MLSAIWTGASNASDIFLLIAAIVAGIATVATLMTPPPNPLGAMIPAAICLIALGILAV